MEVADGAFHVSGGGSSRRRGGGQREDDRREREKVGGRGWAGGQQEREKEERGNDVGMRGKSARRDYERWMRAAVQGAVRRWKGIGMEELCVN